EHRSFRDFVGQGLVHYFFYKGQGRGEVGVPGKVAQGKAYGGDSFDSRLYGSTHGPGVNDAYGGVCPVVDPTYTEIGPAVQKDPEGQFYTVRRGTAATVFPVPPIFGVDHDLLGEQGTVHGNGMALARLGTVRGHYHHLSDLLHAADQGPEPRGGDPVVIGDQNERFFHKAYFGA